MNTLTMHKIAISLILGGTLGVTSNSTMAAVSQNPVYISQMPLSVGASGVAPNIMLMLDNSPSMTQSVTQTAATPSNAPTFSYSCASPYTTGSTSPTSPTPHIVYMTTSNSTVKFCTASSGHICGGNTINFGNTGSAKCFDSTQYYTVTYSGSGNSGVAGANLGTFLGSQLNWYFSQNSFTGNNLTAAAASWTRLAMAKQAAANIVDLLTPQASTDPITVRMGLATYSTAHDGGKLLNAIDNLNSTQATNIKLKANALTATGSTPLAGTLSDIGRYFATGTLTTPQNTNLNLHPSGANTSTDTNSIFKNSIENATGTPTLNSPIINYCQKNAVILISDGLPNSDRDVSTFLNNYTYDCDSPTINPLNKNLCTSKSDNTDLAGVSYGPLPQNVGKYGTGPYVTLRATGSACTSTSTSAAPNWYNMKCNNGTKAGRIYEQAGSDYLDDVAAALYDMDLRPDLTTAHPTSPKHNLSTYSIAIADTSLLPYIRVSNGGGDTTGLGTVLEDAAAKGGGTFQFSANLASLTSTLNNMISNIRKGVGSFSTIAANSTQLGVGTALYQASYDTADWTGDLKAILLDSSTGNAIFPAVWNAGTKIVTPVPAAQTEWLNRNIFTYNTTNKGISFKGVAASVICSKLTAGATSQQDALGITSCTNTSDTGLWRLDFLRGDISHEVVNTSQPQYTTDPRLTGNSATNNIFRNRVRFRQGNSAIGETPAYKVGDVWQDPWLLGDIVNSGATYVSNQDYGYANKGLTESSSYAAFVTSKNSWRSMLYIGANDGFLHGIDASISTADTNAGKEVLAYMPNSIFKAGDGLKNLSSPSYSHQYFVDGTPRVTDVYFNSVWHTVLVGTTGAGGSGIFALDVTDPTGASSGVTGSAADGSPFGTGDVLWEINNTNSATNPNTPNSTDAASFKANLGYSIPQVSIGRMNDGSWAAIVANGYVSANNKAVLYIINIQTGAIIATLDTLTGSATAANGLSSPFAADVDANGTIDAIYAGDLLGNMWKFDVSSDNKPGKPWKIAYGTNAAPAPLFTACSDGANCDTSRQPITNKPQVGSIGTAQSTGGVMVYFGTGQYFQDTDNNVANTQTQTFYGIWDQCPLVSPSTGTANSTTSISPTSVCNTSVTSPTRTTPANTPAGALVQQSIVVQQTVNGSNVRGTSSNTIDWTTQKGWYMDFINPNTTKNDGERIVSASILRDGRIIFSTLIPIPTTTSSTDVCIAGSASTSWVMVLDAITGASPITPALGSSMVTINGKSIPISGQQTTGGSMGTPNIMTGGSDGGQINGGNSSGGIEKFKYTPTSPSISGAGRQSWRQLQL